MFKAITNKILKFAAESLRPHLNTAEKNQKPLVSEATASTAKQIINREDYSYGSANVRLTAEKAQELLALSFQRGPEMFQIRQRDGRSFAMDTAADNCPLAIKNMIGMDGVANEIIYTFFARTVSSAGNFAPCFPSIGLLTERAGSQTKTPSPPAGPRNGKKEIPMKPKLTKINARNFYGAL